jgi:methanogenic corrinoid protein MtbC1
MIDGESFYAALAEGNTEETERLTKEALSAKETAETILENGLIAAMDWIGAKFKNG